MVLFHQLHATREPIIGPCSGNVGEIATEGSTPRGDPSMSRTVECSVLWIVHVRRNLAPHTKKEVVFHPVGRHSEPQTRSPHCLCELSGCVTMRTHFGHGPVAQTAIVHRKTVVMLRDG